MFRASAFAAFLGFISLYISARYLGPVGRGTVSLILVNVSIVQIITAISSSALVYLIPRYPLKKLWPVSYGWGFICCILIPPALCWLGLVDTSFLTHVIIISLFQTFAVNNQRIAVGLNKIRAYNIGIIIQPVCTVFMLGMLLCFRTLSVMTFIYVLYISAAFSFLISALFIRNIAHDYDFSGCQITVKAIFGFGALNQINNMMQLGTYRVSFFFIQRFTGIAQLGVFSLGITLSEAVWLIRNSVTTIHHLDVSKRTDLKAADKNNLDLMKFSAVSTLAALIVSMCIPLKFYVLVFGNGFYQIKSIVFLLSPGIVSLSASAVLTHYFSGIGKVYRNTISASAGFAVILITGWLLIPKYGIYGAAIANTLSYLTTSVVIFLQYKRHRQQKSLGEQA